MGAKDQVEGEEGMAPRKKWMLKARLSADLEVVRWG